MSISPPSLRVRISLACANEVWSGCDFLFACSEATTHQCSKSLAENAFRRLDEHDISRKMSVVFRSIIMVISAVLSSAEVCHEHSRSLEAGRSSVGIAERDDICWFRCVFGASRQRPLRARYDHHAARSRENGYGAIGATT